MGTPQHQFQQEQQQQSKTFRNLLTTDGQIFTPPPFADRSLPQFNPPFHVVGLAPGPVAALDSSGVDLQWPGFEPKNKRLKEQEFVENSQISSVDFLQTRSVSTGLGLSLDDRRMASSYGDSPVLSSLFDEKIDLELQRQDAELDRFVQVQVFVGPTISQLHGSLPNFNPF